MSNFICNFVAPCSNIKPVAMDDMKLKISKSKNSCNLYVQKAYRDNTGKSTSKIVERLGSLDEVRQRAGDRDPIEWAKEYVEKLTMEEKEQRRVIMPRLHPDRLIARDSIQSCHCGYLFLKQIYYKMGMDRICDALSKGRRFDFDLNAVMELLTYGRILSPASKFATHKDSTAYPESFDVDLNHIYRSLDVIADNMDYIQKRLYHNSSSVVRRDTTVLYYDCTNYFFEAEKADPIVVTGDGKKKPSLRQYGTSKEHRPNPIVQMGMFIDNTGFPIAMCINPGNTNEQTTLIPTEKIIIEGMGVEKIVVCTDGGLSSEENRSYNSTYERSFITVQSLKKLNRVYSDWALEAKGWKLMPLTEARKEKHRMMKIKANENPEMEFDLTSEDTARYYGDRTFYRERWIINEKTKFSQRIIVTFSFKYRDYLRTLRKREIEIAESDIRRGTSGKRRSKSPQRFISEAYATQEGEAAIYKTMALNLDAIAEEEKYDGFYAICTDLNDDADQILRMNHNRWESEDAFRVLKTDFKARPVFVWTDQHIKAHFMICFIALLIFRILESRLSYKYTSSQIIRTLRAMTLNILPGDGYRPNYTRTDITDSLHESAGFRTDTEIVTSQKMKRILKDIKKC